MAAKIFRINYKSDFILTLNSDAGWMTPFCIKFWTCAPSQAYFVGFDGTTYTHCAPVDGEPTKLRVQFDDHHLPIGDLKFQIGYHFTVADFPTSVEDEVLNQASVIIEVDDAPAQVMLDLNGETAPEIEFSLPAYANEAQRIANEQERIAAEEQRVSNEQQRISNEEDRISAEESRQEHEQQRIRNEETRIEEFAGLKADAIAATGAANDAATLANEKAALAQQKADYAQAKGDYAKAQGDTALADHERAESDHATAASDHTQASSDHDRAESDHSQAAQDHDRAESDHTRAESDHAAVEVYVDSLGAFDISSYHATGSVLAKYADLTAALGTNGANIPDVLRKGGMSVKFVQSSDNKYVQWRLVSKDWSTDTNNWVAENEDFRNEVMQEVNEAIESIKPIVITGDVTNAPDEHDLTSVNIDGTDVLRFKNKDYAPLIYSGMGRTYQRKNIVNGVNVLTQDMFYKGEAGSRVPNTNTIFLIQYDYDLNGQTITIPSDCVLKFDGGSLKNGEIICQNTILEGNVSVDVISGSIVGEFKSSFSTHSCDYDKLNMLLSLNVDNLVLDEDYSLDSYDGAIQSSLKKVVGNDITISVGCDIVNSNVLGLLLSFNNYPTEISGIKFDFNGHAVRHAIVIQNTAETFYLGDISILNIDNRLENVSTDDHYYCNCINIAPSNNSVVNISNIKVDNMKIWGVGEVGDSNGSQYGIFCNCQTNVVEVNIKSCSFDNIEDYTYDDNSRTIHDSAGLYVSKNINVFETSYNIEGIEGTAFGKRLIKTDGGNVKISNVTGYQGNVDVYPLSLISLNSGDSANSNNKAVYVSNITYTGDSNYVVALLGSGDLNNICVFSKSRNHAIIAAGDKGITVSNVYVNGFRPLVYSTDNNLSCTFNNVTYEYNKDDVPETETISNFYIATGYGLQLFVNNLNLFGGGYGYINFIQGNSYVGQRSMQINGLYYEAYFNGNGVDLATLIEVGSGSYGLDFELNNAIIKIMGNNYRRVFNCPKFSSLTIKNTEINVDAVEIASGSIPYGTFSLGGSNKLHLNNTKVSYRTDWNTGSYSLYISDERTDTSVFDGNSVFISNCNVNEVKKKSGCKTGISFNQAATKVAWSGGDVISVDKLPTGLGINNEGFKTKLSSWGGYGSDKTITWDGFKYVYNIDKVGSTRPSAANVYVGFQFFDTSLSPARPIYVSAISGDTVTWVDATGATV